MQCTFITQWGLFFFLSQPKSSLQQATELILTFVDLFLKTQICSFMDTLSLQYTGVVVSVNLYTLYIKYQSALA